LRERYLALGVPPERLLVAHDGVRAARFDLPGSHADWRRRIGWPEDAFVAGYMGRFHTLGMDKGLGDLVDAVAALAADDAPRPVRLGLVGGPEQTVGALRERGCPPDLILYAGQVPPADVPGYLRAFDVCVMPFPWTEHFAYYASPMKLFEYMASGSPLIATDLPSTAEIVRDGQNGLLVPPADVAALAGALRRLRDDPALADRLAGQAADDVAAHYTWSARADRILDFVAECLPSERGKAAP
jgi:glycosyltransferase involved in cell wall biosynthesis